MKNRFGYDIPETKAGNDALRFVNALTHPKGVHAGQPFDVRPWQRDEIILPLFGTLKEDGTRQYTECQIWVSKKCGKTTLASAIALKMLCADGEIGAHCYGVAKTRQQATLVFDTAAQMLRNAFKSKKLRAKDYKILDHCKRIVYYPTASFYQVLASDAGSADGVEPSFVVMDEIHRQPDGALYEVLSKGMSTRKQPLLLAISTAGDNRGSWAYSQYDRCKSVLSGADKDPSLLPIIYEAAPEDDWSEEAIWHKAMPALDDYVSLDFIRNQFSKAQKSATQELSFRRYYLNQWMSIQSGWFGPGVWDACKGSIDLTELEGKDCYGALDIGATSDLTSFVLAFNVGDKVKLLQWSWCPREGAEVRARQDRVDYLQWAKDGHLKLTDKRITDYEVVRADINALRQKYNIQEIAVDAQFQGWNIIEELITDGFTAYPHAQTFLAMNRPAREFEGLVLSGNLEHGGDPILTWCASNVIIDEKDNLIKPVKDKYTEKVDAIQAAVMAVGRATCHRQPDYDWDNSDIVFV